MRGFRRIVVAAAAAALLLAASAPGARAEKVILGSPLTTRITGGTECVVACTISQGRLPGAFLTSPIDGVIVNWSIQDGTVGKKYRLRILDPKGGLAFSGAATGAEATPATPFSLETFPAVLPIRTGQLVGVDLEPRASIASQERIGAAEFFFFPPVAEGLTSTATTLAREVGLRAEVQPAPRITAIDPKSGPVEGGDTVSITGTDLEGASSVTFGGVPAKTFEVDSEERIFATVPRRPSPATVPVLVKTIAGTATSPVQYTYVGDGGGGEEPLEGAGSRCVVPKLKGKKLKGSKRTLNKAGCRIGKVKKKRGTTASSGKVVKQSQRPGKVLRLKAKVSLTLR
jgi:hypothetical protein